MGILGLLSFLRKTAPSAFKNPDLNGARVAIDTPIFMYKFAYAVGTGKPLIARMLQFGNDLLIHNIEPVFIFDGERLPEKEREKARRLEVFKKYNEKLNGLNFVKIDSEEEFEVEKSTFSKKPIINDFEALKIALDISGFQFKIAKYEAEALCSHLCVSGDVHSVITEDSDALAYLAPRVIVRFNEKREMIDIGEVCRVLNLTPQEFQHMCILFGNDFNGRISGIGPVKAYSLIKKYSTLENVFKHKQVEYDLTEEMQKTKKIFECYCHEVST